MLSKIKGHFWFTCDYQECHEALNSGSSAVLTAARIAQNVGWVIRKNDDNEQYEHFCCGKHRQLHREDMKCPT